MSVSLYDLTVPTYIFALEQLKEFLKKGEKWAEDEGKDKEILLQGRLAPDMLVSPPLGHDLHHVVTLSLNSLHC
jgi:hypothetical protein